MITFGNREIFWISFVCLICVRNGDFAPKKSIESTSSSEEMDETMQELKKNGITVQMIEKFEKANEVAGKISVDFIAKQLTTLSVNKTLTEAVRKELAKNMLEGVRTWYVALEIGLPTMEKFTNLVKKHNGSNLELSLHINYFLRTTPSVNQKFHNEIIDAMREAGVKNTEVAEVFEPESLGYKGNSKLAQELIGLILTNDDKEDLLNM